VLRLSALGLVGMGASACVPDPNFRPEARASGITDSDPSDGPGRGRGVQRASGVTDADPSDGPGRGRGTQRGSGITDADPSDGAGRGRGRSR